MSLDAADVVVSRRVHTCRCSVSADEQVVDERSV